MGSVSCPECKRSVPDGILCQVCGARLEAPVPCRSCGHALSAQLLKCPYCAAPTDKAPPPPPAPPRETAPAAAPGRAAPQLAPVKVAGTPDMQKLRVDVNARAMWGEHRQDIRKDLLKQGVSPSAADRLLETAFKERHAHFRKAAGDDILMGVGCCVAEVVTGFLFVIVSKRTPNFAVVAALWTTMCVLPFAAIYYFVRGGRRLALGGRAERSVTDIDDDLFSE